MSEQQEREVVGVLKDESSLNALLEDLSISDFARHEVSIQAGPSELKRVFGEKFVDPQRLEDNPEAPRQSVLDPEDIGWAKAFIFTVPVMVVTVVSLFMFADLSSNFQTFFALLFGVVVGAGVGFVINKTISMRHELAMNQQSQCGGFVVWLHANTKERIEKAMVLLRRHHAKDVHVHKTQSAH